MTSSDRFAAGAAPRRLLTAVVSIFALLMLSSAIVDTAQAVAATGSTPVGEAVLPSRVADQGLAAVAAGGHVLTRGHGSIPAPLRAQGWVHIGDPDSARGVVVDALQGRPGATSKAFAVTYAGGRQVLLVHPLAAGESYHNSFVTVSPDGRWLVSGEWGTIDRLLVFPFPAPARTALVPTLPLAGVISLRHPVRDVQGCDFSSPTQLLCSTNDTSTSLFPVPRQLLSVQLSSALRGRSVHGAVHLVGSVPTQNVCAGAVGEVEGIDVTAGTVRVAVNVPCAPVTEIFRYPHNAPWRPAGDIDLRASWSAAPTIADAVVERRLVARPSHSPD